MNLILTDKCTNSCPYCFAAMEMSKYLKKNEMTREDFDVFMEFLQSSGEKTDLNVIGGEPLIYSDLDYVMKRLYASEYVTEIFLMTGGIVESSRFAKLLPYSDKTRIMFNVNERGSYRNPSHHSIVERNIREAVSLGLRVCIGFNIYHHDFDGEQIINLCIKHGINHLRFAVACPIYGNDSHQTVVPASEYNVLSEKVFDFLMKCFSAGIEAVLDCPLPLCFFSDAQLGVLSKTQRGVVSRVGKCAPPVDIDFDLTLMRCFSIGSNIEKKKLTDFSSFAEIRQYFIHEVDSRLTRPTLFEECGTCPYGTNCSGGCLSNNPGFLSMPSKMERISNVFNLIDNNDPQEAIKKMEAEPSKEGVDYFLLARLYFSVGDKSQAATNCRKVIHESDDPELREKAAVLLSQVDTDTLNN